MVQAAIDCTQPSLASPHYLLAQPVHLGADRLDLQPLALGREAGQPVFGPFQGVQRPTVTSAFHVMPGDGQLQDTVIELAHLTRFVAPRAFE